MISTVLQKQLQLIFDVKPKHSWTLPASTPPVFAAISASCLDNLSFDRGKQPLSIYKLVITMKEINLLTKYYG
ncbi:MAG: hypothetical protein HEQ27_04760 [Dolichospermum sp. JUN01]|nr:hypothetical protein [Dolichospermum sp. JUN01]